jgi:ribonuclease P protein subunit RPR2
VALFQKNLGGLGVFWASNRPKTNSYPTNLNTSSNRAEARLDTDTRHIAKHRIHMLFQMAKDTIHEDPALAQRYAHTARKIAMSAKLRLPTEYRRQICRHCKSFILPGVNCRVRIKQSREPHVTITCLNCHKQTRIPLGKKKEQPNA